jgi:Purple acid Phosphatase, N-terminal domain
MINQTRREYAVFLLLAGVCVVSIRFLSLKCSWSEASTPEKLQDYTIPTLLSVIDDETGRYQYALENPLYEKLMSGTFLSSSSEVDVADFPILYLNEVDIKIRDPLHLSWTLGHTTTGDAIVEDSDIIVLYCDTSDKKHFLDAATIAQAKATSKKHTLEASGNSDTLKDTVWYFPSFPVIRHEVCQFSLFKTLPKNTFVHLASSQQLNIRDGNTAPTAIHLALGDSTDEMVVQFKTGKEGGTPIVKYGLDEDALLLSATGTTKTYSAKDMCQSPASTEEPGKFLPPGQLHTVRLTHLAPNQTYYYSVGVEYPEVPTRWSELFSFMSAPETKPEPGSFSYIVYGDQGCPSVGWGLGGAWTAAMAARETKGTANSLPIRAVHHFGDLSYARGAAHIWDDWLNMISSFTTRVPLMVSVGKKFIGYDGMAVHLTC